MSERRPVSRPRVHNKRAGTAPDNAVYIGRPSKWDNPFTHHPRGTAAAVRVATREEAVAQYRLWVTEGNGRHLLADLHELHDKDLVCWCKPAACHGDVLVELANVGPDEQPLTYHPSGDAPQRPNIWTQASAHVACLIAASWAGHTSGTRSRAATAARSRRRRRSRSSRSMGFARRSDIGPRTRISSARPMSAGALATPVRSAWSSMVADPVRTSRWMQDGKFSYRCYKHGCPFGGSQNSSPQAKVKRMSRRQGIVSRSPA